MKTFTCLKADIAESISRCARNTPSRPTMEILQCVKVQVIKNGSCIVTATDMETEVMCKTTINPIPKGFTFCVPAKKLDTLLNSFSDHDELTFTITTEGQREVCTLRCGTAEFNLTVWPSSTFPSTSKLEKGNKLQFNCKEFSRMLSKVTPMMANNDVRYYLNGVKVEIEGNSMVLVSTDGHRMSTYNCQIEGLDSPRTDCILPRQAVSEIIALLSGIQDEECQLAFYSAHCRVITSSMVITTKLIDGRYPDWRRVLPDTDNVMFLDKNHFIGVLRRAVVLCNEKFKGVQIAHKEGAITISSTNENQEKGSESMNVQFKNATSHTIGFNVMYLLDAVNSVDGPNIEVHFATDTVDRACFITSQASPEILNTVMPVRI